MAKQNPVQYTKQQFIDSPKYAVQRDVLHALLQDGKIYTTEKVDQLLDGFMKKEAK